MRPFPTLQNEYLLSWIFHKTNFKSDYEVNTPFYRENISEYLILDVHWRYCSRRVTPDFKVEITFWVCLMQRFRKQPPHHCMNLLFYQPVIYKASSSTITVRTHIFNSCEGVLDSDIHVYTPQVSCMNTGKVFFHPTSDITKW